MAKDTELTEVKETQVGFSAQQRELVGTTTPPDKIKQRPGRGGKTFDYVEVGYMVDLLNKTFNYLWDFKITDKQVGKTQVWVSGELTVHIITPDRTITITKSQFGGSDIKKNAQGDTVDIADDFKAASSDCLKKCASMFGFASDIYWKEKATSAGESQNQSSQSSYNNNPGKLRASEKQVKYINVLCNNKGKDREELKKELGVESMNDLTPSQASDAIEKLNAMEDVTSY